MSAIRTLALLLAIWTAACAFAPACYGAAHDGSRAAPPAAAIAGTGDHAAAGMPAEDAHAHDPAHGHAPAGAGAGTFSLRDFRASLGPDEGLMILFSAFFLLLSGAVLWRILLRWTEEQNRFAGRRILQLQRLAFLAIAANLLRHVWLQGGAADPSVLRSLPADPAALAWLVLFALSALGLFLLGRNKLIDALWLLFAVAAVTRIGHAELSLDDVLASLFSAIHLLASALWLGGLYMLLAVRKRYRYEAERLAPNVVNASIAAMVLLFVSGLANSALYLPDLNLIFKTRWGWILAAKAVLFALLALVVLIVRRRGVRRSLGLLRLQFAAVLFLAAASGIMPISDPIPAEGPLHWHVMGDEVHMTGEIDPLRRGDNVYRVTAWFPEGTGAPRRVEMELRLEGREEAVRLVELDRVAKETDLHFVGFSDYYYEAHGSHIDRPGRWTVEVRITDAAGNVWTFDRAAMVY